MKKRILLLLPLFLGACSKSEKCPIITVEKLCMTVDGKEENYADRIEQLPALEEGRPINAVLSLDGNGSELKSFKLQNDEGVKVMLGWMQDEVSTEGNLTDKEKGQLRFKDGVTKATVMVYATVEPVGKNGDVKLNFYLSSKAECEGAQKVIDLKIKKTGE